MAAKVRPLCVPRLTPIPRVCSASLASLLPRSQSLTGHTSPVECVSFDSNEQTVIAGSSGGTLKLWDLDQGKVARTLTGHRSNCVAVQVSPLRWHPYGEFFASGSVDTNLKIWDIRRKTCIQTYKGHTSAVRQILFSPDGRWVVSGGDDGLVKLWDLTMGKLVHEFTQHTGGISALAIHPTEFLMATASADRSLRLWDLESFEQVCCMPPESGQVRRVAFSQDGQALLSGGEESLKVWGWEPVRCYDHAEVRWSRLADFCVGPNQQMVAGSAREAVVAVWSIALDEMKPFNTGTGPHSEVVSRRPEEAPSEPYSRHPSSQQPRSQQPPSQDASHTDAPPPPVSTATCSSPVGSGRKGPSVWRATSPDSCPHTKPGETAPAAPDAGDWQNEREGASRARGVQAANDPLTASCARMHIADCRARIAAVRTQPRTSAEEADLGSASNAETAAAEAWVHGGVRGGERVSEHERKSVGTSMGKSLCTGPHVLDTKEANSSIAMPPAAAAQAAAGLKQAPIDLDPVAPKRRVPARTDEMKPDLLRDLIQASQTGKSNLSERLAALRFLRDLWSAGEVRKLDNTAVCADLMRAGVLQCGALDLECASLVLSALVPLLESPEEDYQLIALEATSTLLQQFGALIHTHRAIVADAVG
ncbi:MAG: hypothetical protein SGPRY_011665, partial [Prymnesium sp.]